MKSFGSLWFQKQAAAWLALYVKLYIPIVLFGWILWFGQLLRVYRVFAQSGWISCSTYVSEWLKKMQTLCSLFKQQLDVLFSTLQPILQVKNKPIYFSEVAFPLSLLFFLQPPRPPQERGIARLLLPPPAFGKLCKFREFWCGCGCVCAHN